MEIEAIEAVEVIEVIVADIILIFFWCFIDHCCLCLLLHMWIGVAMSR
jgi:hypothetical protein